MKKHREPFDSEIPGWDAVEAAFAGLEDLEPPVHLSLNIMAAVQAMPLPRRLEPMPEHHRADLGRTLVLFAVALVTGGMLSLYFAPGLFFTVAGGLWYLLQGAFLALVGLGSGLNLVFDALADQAWAATPLVAVAAVATFLALEWRLLSRLAAGRAVRS